MRYASVWPDDTALRDRMKAIAYERRRYGYRRIHVLLKREGVAVAVPAVRAREAVCAQA